MLNDLRASLRVRGAAWLVVAVALAGCVTQPLQAPQGVVKKDDPFDAMVSFSGPPVGMTKSWGLMTNDSVEWRVRAFKDRSSAKTGRQLHVVVRYDGKAWRYYRSASFAGGVEIPTTRIASRPSCAAGSCSLTEELGVTLSEEQWRQAAERGLSVRLNAQALNAPLIIEVPASYVQAVDAAVSKS